MVLVCLKYLPFWEDNKFKKVKKMFFGVLNAPINLIWDAAQMCLTFKTRNSWSSVAQRLVYWRESKIITTDNKANRHKLEI